MKTVKARFRCDTVTRHEFQEQIEMDPVCSDDPNHPNKAFTDATPCGKLELGIRNKALFGHFQPGQEYDLDITPVQAG